MSRNISSTKYKPVDILLEGKSLIENPFFADIRALFEGPGGVTIIIPGFYDGGNEWKVRFSPTIEGKWIYSVLSHDVEFENCSGEVICQMNNNPNIHGALKIHPESPYHFQYEDGNSHFVMAYEVNWLWALGYGDPKINKIKEIADIISKYRFNHVLVNVYAYDTMWKKGKSSEKDYGPMDYCPWEGNNNNPDHSRLNIEFFRNYDRMMDYLLDKGILAHIYLKVYNKYVSWPEAYSPEDDLYFKYITARYQAYPNVIWDFSKEAYNESDKEYIASRIKLIKEFDGYQRLHTIHDDLKFYGDEKKRNLVDFHTLQQHTDFYYSALYFRSRKRWPIFNAEFAYEHGPNGLNDISNRIGHSPEDVILRAYDVVMAGAYPCYYYTHTAFDVIDYSYTPKGYNYCKILYDFFTSINWWEFEPSPESTLSRQRCLVRRIGKYAAEYVLFCVKDRKKNSRIALKPELEPNREYTVIFINIFTGERKEIDSIQFKDELHADYFTSFEKPFGNKPCLLHIKASPFKCFSS